MRFLTMQRPVLAAAASAASLSASRLGLGLAAAVTVTGAQLTGGVLAQGRRNASVKAQGAYKKKSKRGIPKKLGAKRTGDQFVIPGNIIYKQRGTHWWPGENCIMGRDHTIHSMATGYVKYYRDPARHPDRKYIGVVFDKADVLPYPAHAERRRRLGMTAHAIRAAEERPALSASGIPFEVRRLGEGASASTESNTTTTTKAKGKGAAAAAQQGEPERLLRLRDDYSYREDNWRIGRLVRTTGLRTTRFRTRKQWFRHRRWRRERELEGQRKAAARRAEAGGASDAGKAPKAMSKKAAKKAAKKAGKKK